jgi:hypothetical protein
MCGQRRKQMVQRHQSLDPVLVPIPVFVSVAVAISVLLRLPPVKPPVNRIRDQVPHDDGRGLVQAYDHALYKHSPGQFD